MSLTVKEAIRKWGNEYLAICGIQKYFPTMNGNSHVFWVDGTSTIGNDSDADDGQYPDAPLLTITKALDKCTSGANDYIFVKDYPSGGDSGETWPITIDKQRIHLIGVMNGLLPRFKIYSPYATADTPCIRFSIKADDSSYAAYCEIAGLILGSGNASSIRGAIETHHGGQWGHWIHHCAFGLKYRSGSDCKYGIVIGRSSDTYAAGEMLYSLIENNIFGIGVTADGIFVPDGTGSGPNPVIGAVIRNNHFSVSGIGINVADTTADFWSGGIFNNTFEMSADTDGYGVTFASGAKGNVHGNAGWFSDGVIPANNPFFDAGSTNMSFGQNIRGPGKLANSAYIATPTNI